MSLWLFMQDQENSSKSMQLVAELHGVEMFFESFTSSHRQLQSAAAQQRPAQEQAADHDRAAPWSGPDSPQPNHTQPRQLSFSLSQACMLSNYIILFYHAVCALLGSTHAATCVLRFPSHRCDPVTTTVLLLRLTCFVLQLFPSSKLQSTCSGQYLSHSCSGQIT